MYELRYRENKYPYEVTNCYSCAALAYGMKKKFLKEQPQTYHLSKLIVKKN